MLNMHFDTSWPTGLTLPPGSYPSDFTSNTQQDGQDDLFAGRAANTGRRSAMLADLWQTFEEMKAVNPDVTDREVVKAYQAEHPGRPQVTTKTLRALRYRRKVCEKKQPATAAAGQVTAHWAMF